MLIEITLNNDSDALVGAEGWGEYDARASVGELRQQVADAVAKAYPGAEVSVSAETRLYDLIYIDGNKPENDVQHIKNIIARVWERWEWLVEA
jgi:hypothetical protein